jgi:hypothetical protein
MEANVQKAGAMSPQKLLIGFSKDRLVFWIAVAVAVHIVLIGLLSLGYIRDRWIDPEGAAERKVAAVAAQEALKKETAAKGARPPVPARAVTQAGPATTGVAVVAGASTGTPEQILEERKNAPIVKRITEKAQPGELPAQPNDLDISIDDTHVR